MAGGVGVGGSVRGCVSLRSVKPVPSSSGYNKPKVLVSSVSFHALLTTDTYVNTMATRLQREIWTVKMNRNYFAVSGMNMAFYETCKSLRFPVIDHLLSAWKLYLIKIWITF